MLKNPINKASYEKHKNGRHFLIVLLNENIEK